MSAYTPTSRPIDSHPVVLAGAVAAARFVTPARTQAGADAVVYGVSETAGAAGDVITVHTLGRVVVEAGAAITEGAVVKSDAQGRAIPWATSGARVGIALTSASAAGQKITLFLNPALA